MLNIKNVKRLLTENQLIVVLLGIILGLVFPGQLQVLNTFSTQLLILVFFFSSLRLSLNEVLSYAKDWRMLAITSLYMLVILPFALWFPTSFLSVEWSVALLILGAMPTGMTIALMAEFFGGKTSLALVITTVTSLLAPFTIPLVTKIAVGQSVDIDMLRMFWSLFLTIVAPFVLAMLVKRAVPKQVKKLDSVWRNLSVAAFGILITGIVASTQGGGGIVFTMNDAWMMLISMALLGATTWAAFYIVWWRPKADRMTIALCMLYLNNTLALFVGERFFKDLGVVPKQVLLLLVVNALLPVLKLAAIRVLRTKARK